MEVLLNILTDESQRLFFVGILIVIILSIALVIVIYTSRIKLLKENLLDAKEIDLTKDAKIADLEKKLIEIQAKDDALEQELQSFNETKVSLKSKKELIFKMKEKMDLLEENERLYLSTVEAHIKDFQTLTYKYKSLQKRNEFLVEENSRFRIDNTKILLKVREQEGRIFEKLMSLHGNKEEQRKEIEKFAAVIFEKNRQLFDALRHEVMMAHLEPLADEVSNYQKELIFGYEKSWGRERDLQNDIIINVGLYQKVREDIGTRIEKLKDEDDLARLGTDVVAYLLKVSGIADIAQIDSHEVSQDEEVDEAKKEKQIDQIAIVLPDDQSLLVDATFSLTSYEAYRKTIERSQREKALNDYLTSLKSQIESVAERSADEGYCWMLIPKDEALQTALKHESRLFDLAYKKHVVLVSPTTLLVALQSVAMLWEYKHHYKLANALSVSAKTMYEQFALLGEEMSSVSARLEMLQESLPVKPKE